MILPDEDADGFNGGAHAAFGCIRRNSRRVVVVCIPQHVQHRAAADMEHLRDDHERRRLHFARERARSLPGLPFCGELVRDRHQRRADLAVKAVLGLDHADMVRIAELFCGLLVTVWLIINELISPDAGTVTLGSNVHIGYYDQEHQQLHMEKTIFDEIADDYPNLNNTKVRNVLAAFLFTDDDVYKRIEDLSGGERGRVALAKLMLSDANFLILDEPTNHLDITSKEILEEALKSYTGTVFFVSHDRYFINQTATRILELTGETVVNYIGNYDYYLEKHDQMVALYVKKPEDEAQTEASVKETAQKVDWQTQKAEQARIRKIENALKKAEEKIAELEDKIASIDAECAKPEVAVNSAKLGELTKQQSEYQEELEKQYEVWEELSMELDA